MHDCSLGWHAIVAIMLHIDHLPHDGFLGRVEARIQEMLVALLIALEQTRRFGHQCVQIGNHAKSCLRFGEQRLAGFRRSVSGVEREIGHGPSSLIKWRQLRRGVLSDYSRDN